MSLEPLNVRRTLQNSDVLNVHPTYAVRAVLQSVFIRHHRSNVVSRFTSTTIVIHVSVTSPVNIATMSITERR